MKSRMLCALLLIIAGTMAASLEDVEAIVETGREGIGASNFVQIGVGGGYYLVVGGLSETFGNGFAATLFFECNLRFLFEGLFAGIEISYHNISCVASPNYSYLLFNCNAEMMYRVLFPGRVTSFARRIAPFVGIGAGAALPVLTYGGTTGYEVVFSFTGKIGADIFLNENLFIRAYGGWLSVLQTASWFNTISVNLGAACGF